MKRLVAVMLILVSLLTTAFACADGLMGCWYDDGYYRVDTYQTRYATTLKTRLATRSGPSTNYDGLGSYFKEGHGLTVLSRAFDDRNGIWWVQVEINYNGALRRAYTGLKRVNIDINLLPDESPVCEATITTRTIPYYGPGYQYSAHKNAVAEGTTGIVYAFEDGWVQFEFYEKANKRFRRIWVPDACISWDDYMIW